MTARIAFETVHQDGQHFGFVSDHGQVGRFRAYAYDDDDVGLAHFAGEHADDAHAAAAVLAMCILLRLPAEGNA